MLSSVHICYSDGSISCSSIPCNNCALNDGRIIEIGGTYQDDCNTCTCVDSDNILCTQRECNGGGGGEVTSTANLVAIIMCGAFSLMF
ncbi:uncharacterized protein [Dysidea avara]|uniref:uncharacterized protein isoform X2 n=1 Tax=Dysidea avara TaxID=196820 RepID=UPI00332D7999